jgi:hypothetical protein
MTEELRKLEQARDLLREVEGRLRGRDSPEVEDRLTRLSGWLSPSRMATWRGCF